MVEPVLRTTRRCRRYVRLIDLTRHVWFHVFQENSMKPLERLTHRVIFRSGIIVVAATMVLALSSTSARHVGLDVLAATVIGVSSAPVAAAEDNDTAIRPFRVNVPKAISPISAGASRRLDGLTRRRSQMNRRARSSRRSRSSFAIGAP